MPLPLIPFALAALTGAVGWQQWKKRKKSLTDEQKRIYDHAINELKDPEKLVMLSGVFKEQGHTYEADMLQKRANLRSMPPELKKARRQAFSQIMKSKDPVAVRKAADAYEQIGATGSAGTLRKYAETLEAGGNTGTKGSQS
jgi:hypothetical protein